VENIKNYIWDELQSKRGEIEFSSYSDLSFLEWVGNEKGSESLKKIFSNNNLLQSAISPNVVLCVPNHLNEFIFLFLKNSVGKKILDPFFHTSSVLIRKNLPNYEGYTKNKSQYDLITKALNQDSNNITLGDGLDILENSKRKYDIICSFPPFNYRSEKKGRNIKYSEELFFESSKSLTKNGVLIFLFPPSFFINKNIKEKLLQAGISIKGIFFLDKGSHLPQTNIGSCLIIAEKGTQEKTFVAKLSNTEANKIIHHNFFNSKKGKIVELGTYVDFNKFRSLDELISEKRLKENSIKTGFKPINLSEISESIKTISSNLKEIENTPNSIYIPRIGNSYVVIDPSEFTIKKQNYIKVVLKKNISPIYLSNYLNNPPGNLNMEMSLTGTVIKNRTVSSIERMMLFIPTEQENQKKFIEANTKIQNLLISINELKSNLWNQPKKVDEISQNIKSFEKDETIDKWIKTLPFPLASILWKYHSNLNKEKKIRYLFSFFEALPEFMSLIILSSFNNNTEFIRQNKENWISKNLEHKKWYEKSSFGGWNNLFSNLSKFLRIQFNDPNQRDFINDLLGAPSKHFAEFVTKKDVINILNEVCDYRNKWKGHGGDVDESGIDKRLYLLEQNLNKMRQNIKSSFETFKLISPGKSEYDSGVHTYEIKELRGTTTPFLETKIESLIPLEKSKLYIIHNDNNTPIEVLPIIKYNSKEKALYFYSSVETNGIRYVSYHYETQPEINHQVNEDFKKILDLLNSNEELKIN